MNRSLRVELREAKAKIAVYEKSDDAPRDWLMSKMRKQGEALRILQEKIEKMKDDKRNFSHLCHKTLLRSIRELRQHGED